MDLTIKICKYNFEYMAQFIPMKHTQYVMLKKFDQGMKITTSFTTSAYRNPVWATVHHMVLHLHYENWLQSLALFLEARSEIGLRHANQAKAEVVHLRQKRTNATPGSSKLKAVFIHV